MNRLHVINQALKTQLPQETFNERCQALTRRILSFQSIKSLPLEAGTDGNASFTDIAGSAHDNLGGLVAHLQRHSTPSRIDAIDHRARDPNDEPTAAAVAAEDNTIWRGTNTPVAGNPTGGRGNTISPDQRPSNHEVGQAQFSPGVSMPTSPTHCGAEPHPKRRRVSQSNNSRAPTSNDLPSSYVDPFNDNVQGDDDSTQSPRALIPFQSPAGLEGCYHDSLLHPGPDVVATATQDTPYTRSSRQLCALLPSKATPDVPLYAGLGYLTNASLQDPIARSPAGIQSTPPSRIPGEVDANTVHQFPELGGAEGQQGSTVQSSEGAIHGSTPGEDINTSRPGTDTQATPGTPGAVSRGSDSNGRVGGGMGSQVTELTPPSVIMHEILPREPWDLDVFYLHSPFSPSGDVGAASRE
ncbi:hypothetical protein P154DRAFT_232818 [Amniculicola lignicola CBS 123094]|uniref:Uncharacterized protein n=1 Tax=Amniculicola lignicola CBS 123094 TaxID=1392246 RepID=A0A6A5WBJ5_9PLEO|nr:hypothetical protein P154DRAFT_232818 [Amniculicola lignicola CBS 123094]